MPLPSQGSEGNSANPTSEYEKDEALFPYSVEVNFLPLCGTFSPALITWQLNTVR